MDTRTGNGKQQLVSVCVNLDFSLMGSGEGDHHTLPFSFSFFVSSLGFPGFLPPALKAMGHTFGLSDSLSRGIRAGEGSFQGQENGWEEPCGGPPTNDPGT